MSIRPDAFVAILMMAAATYLCRAGGYFLMRFVRMTPRVEAWLKAMPIALVGAIVGPAAVNGGPAEWVGLLAAVVLMRLTANDFLSSIGAVGVVAALRYVT